MASDSQADKGVRYIADDHLRPLMKGKKAMLADRPYVSYPEGWAFLVERFVNEIKGYSIEIRSVSDDHAQLDVLFEVVHRTNEVKVWRAIDQLRRQSWKTCSTCGKERGTMGLMGISGTKCMPCLRDSKEVTGTWLDKY